MFSASKVKDRRILRSCWSYGQSWPCALPSLVYCRR